MAWPVDVADGQILLAAHVNAIKNSVATWQGDVNANNFAINNVGDLAHASNSEWHLYCAPAQPIMFYTTAIERMRIAADGVVTVVRSNNAGVGPDLALSNPAGGAGDKARISFLDQTTYRATIVQSLDPASGYGGQMDFCTGAPNANPDALTSRLQITGTGVVKLWLGGTLKTLSVDGSGFVKAA